MMIDLEDLRNSHICGNCLVLFYCKEDHDSLCFKLVCNNCEETKKETKQDVKTN